MKCMLIGDCSCWGWGLEEELQPFGSNVFPDSRVGLDATRAGDQKACAGVFPLPHTPASPLRSTVLPWQDTLDNVNVMLTGFPILNHEGHFPFPTPTHTVVVVVVFNGLAELLILLLWLLKHWNYSPVPLYPARPLFFISYPVSDTLLRQQKTD